MRHEQLFANPEDYELFLYSLTEQFTSIRSSTIVFIRKGATLARVAGELYFDQGVKLVVRERVLYHQLPTVIDWCGYEVWQSEEKLYWYDSQPHPNEPKLESTHPHHKHVPPNIKHNRIPAPHMSFMRPNLPVLIQEIEELLQQKRQSRQMEQQSGFTKSKTRCIFDGFLAAWIEMDEVVATITLDNHD